MINCNINIRLSVSAICSFLGLMVFTSFAAIFATTFATPVFADVISANVSPDIQEPAGTYNQGGLNILNLSVDTVIGTGSCVAGDYSGCTLNDVLNDTDSTDDFKPEVKVHIVADDFPDDGLVSNATLRQRGSTSRQAPQKSFRIKLDSKNNLWRGERKFQLVKSAFDFTRVRNKLSYDLLAEIPHLPSMRTQFVNLSINDQGTNQAYGLFTHVENFGKEYLKRRGWDKDSRVYKVSLFEFYNDNPALLLDAAGAPVDLDAFEKLIEIKRGLTHFDLINMLNDLNNPDKDFNTQIMGKYFNRDNYLSWFAFNILVNNVDTTFHNYYLYNPKNNEHFYLVPWDYDLSFGQFHDAKPELLQKLPRWWFSHANWWEVLLHKRFLRQPGNLQLLKDAVFELKNKYLSANKIQAKADSYRDLVFPIIRQQPDWDYLYVSGNTDPERVAEFNRIFDSLSSNVEFNYSKFMERANDPMPFWMDAPIFKPNHDILFQWSESESLTGQTIQYDLEVSTTKDFKAGTIVETKTGISQNKYTLHWTHPKGNYFFRVRARDAYNPQSWQEASNDDDNLVYDGSDLTIYGVKKMYVPTDGDSTPPPSGNVVSNPVNSILVDGDNSDWNGLQLFATDPDDIPSGVNNIADWSRAGIAHTSQNVYFMYENYGAFSSAQNTGSYISWGWHAYIDTDKNPSTGFKASDALGAEYLLSGSILLKYNGTGSDWNWVEVANGNSSYISNIAELGFSRSMLGNPDSMRIIFNGSNAAFGGSTEDAYPDGAFNSSASIRYFEYSFGGGITPTNHAPVSTNQNLSLIENTRATISLIASDADNDPLTLDIVTQPAHGRLIYSASSLTLEYQPDQNYTGSDSFRFRVSDGTDLSNIATVNLNITARPPVTTISNHVISNAITVNGNSSDWSGLTLFAGDPDDIGSAANNVIDWLSAGLAHSSDTIYLLYKNQGNVSPDGTTGSTLQWGWQTFFDTDNDTQTGFHITGSIGADYMLEGRHIYKYNGTNQSWDWVETGVANLRFNGDTAELSFPRNFLPLLSTIKVVFLGNNAAFAGNTVDLYPDNGSFSYSFGSGQFGKTINVSNHQKGIKMSPKSHTPGIENANTGNSKSAKGGSISFLILLFSLLGMRNVLRKSRNNCY